MPKHAFKFPYEVVEAVKRHVARAIEAVDPSRYNQEPPYTAALVNRLEGTVYEGEHGHIRFISTVFDDRARNAAESRIGADFAITASISDGRSSIQKTILVQAKLGQLSDLDEDATIRLRDQIAKMKVLVNAPKVMQIEEIMGKRFPQIISGNRVLHNEPYIPMDLPSYFVARVTTTLDGCTDPHIVSIVQDSSLTTLHVKAKLIVKV